MREIVVVGLAVLGGFIMALHVIADSLQHLGFRLGVCEAAPTSGALPWNVLILAVACVLPLTVGAATTSNLVQAAAGFLPWNRNKTPPPENPGG